MSRRNRRQDDLDELARKAEELGSTSEDEEEPETIATPSKSGPKSGGATSAFAALESEAGDDDEDQDLDSAQDTPKSKSKRKKNKKKKKPAVALSEDAETPEEPRLAAPEAAPIPKPAKSNKKKAGKTQEKAQAEDDDLDEIDRALKELGQTSASQSQGQQDSPAAALTTPRIRSLLAIETKHLDAEAELKRFFGAHVVASTAQTSQGRRGARAQNPHHALGRQFARGGMLAKPQQNWPPIAFSKSGLNMELVEASAGEALWTFEHTKTYVEVTQMYLEAIASHDPNQLMALMHVHPYHAETLLGLSDMAALQGDPGMSQDFLDRALYAYEKAFAPSFNLQNGNARVDFRRIESRGFFRALEKRISSLMKRGTWRTLHEHAKLLYAISPFDDPYGALLFMDFTATKCKQYTWFLDLLEELPRTLEKMHDQHLQLDSYPGLFYAKALCRWHLEEDNKQSHDQSTKDLKQSFLRYPLTATILLDKLGSSIPRPLYELSHAQVESGYHRKPSYILQLLSQLYVHRSDTLWKEPEVLQWLQDTIKGASTTFVADPSHPDVVFGKKLWEESLYPKNGVPEGIYRHILVSDIQSIRLYLPQTVLNSLSMVYDPLPPGPGFDDAYFRTMYDGSRNRRGGAAAAQAGSANAQANAEGFMQRLMQYLQAGPGREGMDPDTEAAVMAQLEQFTASARRGGVPGDFPGSGDADSEGEADNGEARTAGVMEFFRGLWGSQQPSAAHEVQGEDDESGTD